MRKVFLTLGLLLCSHFAVHSQTPEYTQSTSFACNQETCNGLPLDQGGQWQFIEANSAFSLYHEDSSGHIIFGMFGNPGNPGTGGISNLQDQIPEPPNTNGASGAEGQLTFNYSAVDYSNNSIHYNGRVVANGHEVRHCFRGCWDVMIVDDAQIYINGLNLSSSSLNFGLQKIGSTSPSQTVTVTNVSSHPVTFASITSSGNFPETNTCPSTLNPGLNCTITIAFRPTVAGNRPGAVTLKDNDPGSPKQTISLTGIGEAKAMTLIPSNLSFPGQIPGTTTSNSITLYNDGTAPVNIANIDISPASTTFTQTNNCQSTLNPNTNCVIQVSFTPPDTGTFNATLSVTDSDKSSPQTASLSGVGLDN
jgi:hypothetical protein